MLQLFRTNRKGFTLIELLIVVAIIGILAAIAIPNLLSAQRKAKYSRAAADAKTASTQAIVYSNDNNKNPGTMKTLRDSGYANIPDNDPWAGVWIYSPSFADTTTPANTGEIGICSKGPNASGTCTFPLTALPASASNGSVGYSNVYGSWQGT